MPKSSKVRVTLKGAGLQYSEEISPEVAAEVMGICLPAKEDSTTESVLPRYKTSRSQESPAEYLRKFAPERNPDKVVVLGAYLKEARGQHSFSTAEIKKLLRDAGESLPGNFTRDLRVALKNAWIASDPYQKGMFYVTNLGFKVMQGGFPKTLTTQPGRRKKSKKGSTPKAKKLKK